MASVESAYSELLRRSRETATLSSCGSVLGWDERTYMPPRGAEHRAEQMALLAKLSHQMATDPALGELFAVLEPLSRADSPEAANVREMRRSYERATKLPPRLVEELARVTTQAQQVWQAARAASDFAAFRPSLEKIVELKREEAQAVGYESHPYDALLDEFEPGATTAELTATFAELAATLTPLIQALITAPKPASAEILAREYPLVDQEAFARSAAQIIGYDFQAGRLDTTTHPFCIGIGPGDVRITTRYGLNRFGDAFFGVLHEAGHAMYEQGLDRAHYGTPLGSAASLGIHESQSRLWENQVGRSEPFWQYFFPLARQQFSALADVEFPEWLRAINSVRPSFIRVDADEVTYNLHVVLRFELEQALLTGDLAVADVPGAWDDGMQRLLGIRPPTAAQGCLQDIHWSGGGLGYFPTYTLGNLYAAQFMEQARFDLPGLEDDFRAGQFARLKGWLNDRIHRHGMRWRAKALCERVTGRPLSARPFLDYLDRKYRPLYGLAG